jgi:hypothetical protein
MKPDLSFRENFSYAYRVLSALIPRPALCPTDKPSMLIIATRLARGAL